MSADDETDETEEKKPYGFVGRMILFLIIAGPASVFAFGIYARIGIRASMTAVSERGDSSLMLILVCWLLGMVGTAVMIFKR